MRLSTVISNRARGLLRLALPGQDELLEFAPKDDDLIALRDEIPALYAFSWATSDRSAWH